MVDFNRVLLGCDPELFLKKDGKLVSAHGLFEGDKANPQVVENGAVQVDGMAAEFNIDPAHNEDEFVRNIQGVMGILDRMLPEYTLHADPVAHFGKAMINAQPKEAKELGCDPDFSAWTGTVNTPPDVEAPFRTGAGHIHFGVCEGSEVNDPDFNATCCEAVKELDFYLALPSLVYDGDVQRRSLYGAAGAYRPKSYGFEYRTLSNKWLSSEKLMRWAYRNSQLCMEQFFNGERLVNKYGDIQDIINTSDVEAAKAIIADARIPLPQGV